MNHFTVQSIGIDDLTETRKWDTFVENHPGGTPYHLTPWINTIKDTYKYLPTLYTVTNEVGNIECVFPIFHINGLFCKKRIISLPFSDYGGPVSNNEVFTQLVIDKINKEHTSFCKNIEIRSIKPIERGFEKLKYYKRHVLMLDVDEKKIKSNFNKRTIQYSIRKAEREGVTVHEDNSLTGLKHFIRLNRITRKKHGVPSQPDIFFYNLFKNIIDKNYGFILLAALDSKIIAASLFIRSGKQIHYKYNASDSEYLKKFSPNHLITWSAIKKGIADGYHVLDFGRTASDNQGLIRYKQMWGAHEFDCDYCFFPKVQGASSLVEDSLFYKSATRIWKMLPGFIHNWLSTYIYRYLC